MLPIGAMDLTASYAKRWGKRIRKNLKRKEEKPEPWELFSEPRTGRKVAGGKRNPVLPRIPRNGKRPKVRTEGSIASERSSLVKGIWGRSKKSLYQT